MKFDVKMILILFLCKIFLEARETTAVLLTASKPFNVSINSAVLNGFDSNLV